MKRNFIFFCTLILCATHELACMNSHDLSRPAPDITDQAAALSNAIQYGDRVEAERLLINQWRDHPITNPRSIMWIEVTDSEGRIFYAPPALGLLAFIPKGAPQANLIPIGDMLLQREEPVNMPNANGTTPLGYVCLNPELPSAIEATAYLLSRGADQKAAFKLLTKEQDDRTPYLSSPVAATADGKSLFVHRFACGTPEYKQLRLTCPRCSIVAIHRHEWRNADSQTAQNIERIAEMLIPSAAERTKLLGNVPAFSIQPPCKKQKLNTTTTTPDENLCAARQRAHTAVNKAVHTIEERENLRPQENFTQLPPSMQLRKFFR